MYVSFVDAEMVGHVVKPGANESYTFTVPWSVSPGVDDPDCIPYMYYSAYNFERDINSGLVGPLVICRSGTLTQPEKKQVLIKNIYPLTIIYRMATCKSDISIFNS